jgi:FkbM family methyltransferase
LTEFSNGLDELPHIMQTRLSTSEVKAACEAGCWIYGAGGYGQRVLRALQSAGLPCAGFIDRRASDVEFAKSMPAPAMAPAEFRASDAEGRTLIVGVMNTHESVAGIESWGRTQGFRHILSPMHLPEIFGAQASNYWMVERGHAAEHLDEIREVASWLADEASVSVLLDLVRFRISGDIRFHPAVDIPHQYYPPDVPIDLRDGVFVDCGAYTGDTYQALVRLGAKLRQWIAFEPDLENYKKLSAVAQAANTEAFLYPCGVGDTMREVSFSVGEGAASHVGGDASRVRVLALDGAIPQAQPTYIKLDIEGFEAEALRGMQKLLTRSRPALAVSVYHKPADLWELPRLVRSLLPNSRLYLRQHGHNGFDTVLYAIP